jgi:hypothetical protein
MEQAIKLLQQHIRMMSDYLGREAHAQLPVLEEIERTAQSLRELHQISGELQAAHDAVEKARQQALTVSNMGTVPGSRGHMIVSAVMAKRAHLRKDLKEEAHKDLTSRELLEELGEILDQQPLPDGPHGPATTPPVIPVPPSNGSASKPKSILQQALSAADKASGGLVDSLERHLQAQRHHPNRATG